MLNSQKFTTAEERGRAFDRWCRGNNGCDRCTLHDAGIELSTCVCSFYWLDLEAEEEKPLPCPYCGGETEVVGTGAYQVVCMKCMYASAMRADMDLCVSDHNRVARAVMEAGKKEKEVTR